MPDPIRFDFEVGDIRPVQGTRDKNFEVLDEDGNWQPMTKKMWEREVRFKKGSIKDAKESAVIDYDIKKQDVARQKSQAYIEAREKTVVPEEITARPEGESTPATVKDVLAREPFEIEPKPEPSTRPAEKIVTKKKTKLKDILLRGVHESLLPEKLK